MNKHVLSLLVFVVGLALVFSLPAQARSLYGVDVHSSIPSKWQHANLFKLYLVPGKHNQVRVKISLGHLRVYPSYSSPVFNGKKLKNWTTAKHILCLRRSVVILKCTN